VPGAQRDRVGHRLQIQLQFLGVAGRLLVQQHDIDCEAACAPELERVHHLTYQGHVGGVLNAHHQNRQVTRDAHLPQVGLRPRCGQLPGGGPQVELRIGHAPS